MANWNFSRDESTAARTGIMRCVIVDAEETVSKSSGKPMIVVTVRPSGSSAKVKEFIVMNDKFNQRMTRFFDSFPSIPEGNFEFLSWVGAEGAANFGEDENGYLKVKWFIEAEKALNLPAFVGDKPQKQEVTSLGDSYEVVKDESDLPF